MLLFINTDYKIKDSGRIDVETTWGHTYILLQTY